MVSAVHYLATERDQELLLDSMREPAQVSLHPWPLIGEPLVHLTRIEAMLAGHAMVVNRSLGLPVGIRSGDAVMEARSKAAVFNRINWDRLQPSATEWLVDSNASPVLLWTPASLKERTFQVSTIGSQADAMDAVGPDYVRWAQRVMSWIRRNGTKVWGLEQGAVRPDLDIELGVVSAIFALPDALTWLERGYCAR